MAKKEDRTQACLTLVTIIHELAKQPPDERRDGALLFALEDLAHKAGDLRISGDLLMKVATAIEGCGSTAPQEKFERIRGAITTAKGTRKVKADVVVLTVIDVERTAALKTFAVDRDTADKSDGFILIRGTRFYSAQLPMAGSHYRKRKLQLYIGMVGEPRNVPCANMCRDIFEKIDADLVVLVGIAGGNHESDLALGDVIGAQGVFYLEGGKRRAVRLKPPLAKWRLGREKTATLREIIKRAADIAPEVIQRTPKDAASAFMRDFSPDRFRLADEFRKVELKYSEGDYPHGKRQSGRAEFDYEKGQILCGEKVIVDFTLADASHQINRKIACVDMESYGFAETLEHLGKQWVIFRGVSDFANPKKDDAKHVSASIAAAVTAKAFLEQQYIEPEALAEPRL